MPATANRIECRGSRGNGTVPDTEEVVFDLDPAAQGWTVHVHRSPHLAQMLQYEPDTSLADERVPLESTGSPAASKTSSKRWSCLHPISAVRSWLAKPERDPEPDLSQGGTIISNNRCVVDETSCVSLFPGPEARRQVPFSGNSLIFMQGGANARATRPSRSMLNIDIRNDSRLRKLTFKFDKPIDRLRTTVPSTWADQVVVDVPTNSTGTLTAIP